MNKKKKKGLRKNQTPFLVGMLALPVIHWLIFFLYVNINSILLAFKDPRTKEWTMGNFKSFWEMLTSPYGELGLALKNTLYYYVQGLISMFLCLWIAYFFYKRIRGQKVFRILFYTPAIISGVVLTTAFRTVVMPGGPLDGLLSAIGVDIPPEGLFANPETATKTILIYCLLTSFTGNVLMYNSAMSRIPVEVLESAALDGCSTGREFFSIILPLIWPTMASTLILSLTGILTASGPILLFTNGSYKTTTISFWIFNAMYNSGAITVSSVNLVSCVGLCFSLIALPIILFARKVVDRVPTVEY